MQEVMDLALKNLQTNKARIDQLLAETETIVGTFSPEVQAAFTLIMHTFGGDAKVAGQMLASLAQQEKLATASGEVGALIAAAQVVLGNQELLDAAQAKATANTEVAGNPLSDAAGVSESSAADPASTGETAAAAAPAESGQV